ncbi:MAG TPA: cell division protein FtsA [Clostridiales bacterium UBA8960]|nr:cell division protein FtsA [Clostridiales bacterium UBA8960]
MSIKRSNPMPKNLMFALDIGTRSVVGIISKKEGKKYIVLDYEMMEHPDRAMFDGQIHDIMKVTEVVKTVVEKLEERNGYRLEQAAIAAAGRALKTERALFEMEIDVTKEIDKTVTDSIEMQAIQLAQRKLSEDKQLKSSYYCVGYSVINFYLDQSMILNPTGHRGNRISVEIIATFLPHIVVDSLYSVVHKAGLEVMNLTLEPIAAMNVAIPPNLRLLNLSLVDVGAGTSDIAISRDGSVVSYGMVGLAGDEITEKIAQTYLLDFNSAEKLKIALSSNDTLQYKDVLGLTHQVTAAEVIDSVNDLVKHITGEIAENIIQLNKKPPSAVFCIGGGAQVPGFTRHLAEALSLNPERVVIKSAEMLDMIAFECTPLTGPEFVTPIGIGITAFEERDQDFIQVNVNETAIRLFNSKPLRVSDALILTGYNARSLISERGESYFITVDGVSREIKGEYGEPAHIYINSIPAHLDGKINHKDQITVIPAEKGKQRKVRLRDVVNMEALVKLGGQDVKIVEFVSVNGVNRTDDYMIIEGDEVETKGIKTVEDLARAVELDMNHYAIFEGNHQLDRTTKVKANANYYYKKVENSLMTDVDLMKKVSHDALNLIINGSNVTMPVTKNEMVFVDVFDHISFDLSKPQGILILKLNGERARYTDILSNGDVVDIYWNN